MTADAARFGLTQSGSPSFGVQSHRQVMKKIYTEKQGQYLAFIHYYGKIHGCAPSEAEMQQHFRVSPPSVHQMILTLEARGLIERTPGQARSIHLLISHEELPDLE
jgi:DNA-binding MarR family transcriptional regulator